MTQLAEPPNRYSVDIDYSGTYDIESVDELIQWVSNRSTDYQEHLEKEPASIEFNPNDIGGLFTVQTSLKFVEEEGVFKQRGTAPNYFGDTWSFATCRWMHRGHDAGSGGWNFDQFFTEDPDDDDRLYPHQPTLFINATGSQHLHGRSRRPIVSVAFITHGFWTVDAYTEYLTNNCSERAISHRLTHDTDSRKHEWAIEFGDCHADSRGNVDEPPEGHDHHSGTESACGCETHLAPHKDTATDHIKCLSLPGYWHAFSGEPKLEASNWPPRGVKYIKGEDGLRQNLTEFGLL